MNQGALQTLLTVFQNVGPMIKADAHLSKITNDLPYALDDYNMTCENESTFLDIGSGFGKPVFHAAM